MLILFQVNVVHISATSKNAADDKLRQSMRRFADNHSPPASVILISSKWYFNIACAEQNDFEALLCLVSVRLYVSAVVTLYHETYGRSPLCSSNTLVLWGKKVLEYIL